MAVTVPATDPTNYALQALITTLASAVTANANPATLAQTQATLFQLRMQLVIQLMGQYNPAMGGQVLDGGGLPSSLNPATILSSLTINT